MELSCDLPQVRLTENSRQSNNLEDLKGEGIISEYYTRITAEFESVLNIWVLLHESEMSILIRPLSACTV
jgi:hypothetical protein